eukprot:s11_g5.t1
MIDLRADANAQARTGVTPLFVARSPGQTALALLESRCDPTDIGEAKYGPLHALALYSRSNRYAVETAKLLLQYRADVNAQSAPSGRFLWECRLARARAMVGFPASTMMSRLRASMPGITPLGYAALVGCEDLTPLGTRFRLAWTCYVRHDEPSPSLQSLSSCAGGPADDSRLHSSLRWAPRRGCRCSRISGKQLLRDAVARSVLRQHLCFFSGGLGRRRLRRSIRPTALHHVQGATVQGWTDRLNTKPAPAGSYR